MSEQARAFARVGDLQSAIHTWQAAMDRFGPFVEALDSLWQAFYSLGDYPAAATYLERLLELQPEAAKLHYQLGTLLAVVDPASAIQHLDQARWLDPQLSADAGLLREAILSSSLAGDQAYILVIAGRALAALNEWPLAAAAFSQAMQVNPKYAEAWAYLGEARQHLVQESATGNSQSGLAEIQRALQLDPRSLSGHLFLSLYWSRQGRFDQALQAVRTAITIHPQEAILYSELGRVLALSGDLAGAAQAYLQAAELEPHQAAYWRQVVKFSLTNNYLIEVLALPAAQAALELAPGDVANLDAMAQVSIRLGDLDRAWVLLEQALKTNPNDADSHLHYGYLLLLKGNNVAALEHFRLAQNLDPQSQAAEQAQRLIEGMLK